MHSGPVNAEPPDVAQGLARSWQVGLFVGIVTVILGIVVTAHPSTSLNVIAALLGILLLVSGLFYLVRALDPAEAHRAWVVIVGLLFMVIGIFLIRHLDLTRNLIAFLIGITWIVQGMVGLVAGFSDKSLPARGWTIGFGCVSLLAGIVVLCVPVGSLVTLAVLFGIWFIVLGLLQIVGALNLRHALKAGA